MVSKIKVISDNDLPWLNQLYPELKLTNENTVTGNLKFKATYCASSNFFQIIYPDSENSIGGIEIDDNYNLTIKAREPSNPTGLKLPAVLIDKGRFELIEDRHINDFDKSACLCGPVEEQLFISNGYTLQGFIEKLVVPFLYEQTFFSLYDEWPWGEYGHGAIGALESYLENKNGILFESIISNLLNDSNWQRLKQLLTGKNGIKGHFDCYCGSGAPIRNCHANDLSRLNKIKSELAKNPEIINFLMKPR